MTKVGIGELIVLLVVIPPILFGARWYLRRLTKSGYSRLRKICALVNRSWGISVTRRVLQPRWPGPFEAGFFTEVGERRARIGLHVAAIAAMHGLDVDGDLAETLPQKDEGAPSVNAFKGSVPRVEALAKKSRGRVRRRR